MCLLQGNLRWWLAEIIVKEAAKTCDYVGVKLISDSDLCTKLSVASALKHQPTHVESLTFLSCPHARWLLTAPKLEIYMIFDLTGQLVASFRVHATSSSCSSGSTHMEAFTESLEMCTQITSASVFDSLYPQLSLSLYPSAGLSLHWAGEQSWDRRSERDLKDGRSLWETFVIVTLWWILLEEHNPR